MNQKKYGLIQLSKQNKPNLSLKKNIFESDSDEDSETNVNPKRVETSSGVRRQTQLDISRALAVDPNVFEYDSVYDDMKSKTDSNDLNESEDKPKPKPKYINNLLKFSENRKKENERRLERKIQKDRESEGNEFKDKEEFVTNAYKLKLEEMKAEDEKDRREAAIEELLDVKKQKDLSGFYRHLLNNDISSQPKDSNPEPIESPKDIPKDISITIPKPKTNRQFRRRRSSSDESEEELPQKDETNVTKLEKSDKKVDKIRDNLVENKRTVDRHQSLGKSEEMESIDDNSNHENNGLLSKQTKNISNDNKNDLNLENSEKPTKIVKLNKREVLLKMFTKRTVEDVYTEAKNRYIERRDKYIL